MYFITYVIILSMLLCINREVLKCLEYPSKHAKLHKGVDYIVYLRYCIDFNSIVVEGNFVFCFGAQFNSTHNFTQSGWPILFTPDLFPGQQKLGKLPNTVSLAEQRRTHEGTYLIYGFLVSISFRPRNPSWIWIRYIQYATTGTTLCHPQNWLCRCDALFRSRHLALNSPLGHFNGDSARLSPKSTRLTKLTVTPKFISSNGKQDFR